MLITPLVQGPLFLSFFLALRKMAETPVPSFTTGGAFWFPDLTLADPQHILPIVCASTMLLAVELGMNEMGVEMNNQQKFVKYLMRGMCAVMVPIAWTFPTATVTYWVT